MFGLEQRCTCLFMARSQFRETPSPGNAAWQVPEVEDDDRERWGEKRTSACGRADAIKVLLVAQNFQLSSPSLKASGTSCSLEGATQSL